MASPISYTAASVSLTSLTIVQTSASESSLVDLTVFQTTERHAVILQLQVTPQHLSVEAARILNGKKLTLNVVELNLKINNTAINYELYIILLVINYRQIKYYKYS